jgi:hypothetical protein
MTPLIGYSNPSNRCSPTIYPTLNAVNVLRDFSWIPNLFAYPSFRTVYRDSHGPHYFFSLSIVQGDTLIYFAFLIQPILWYPHSVKLPFIHFI